MPEVGYSVPLGPSFSNPSLALSLSTQLLSFNSSSFVFGPILPLSLPPVELSVDTKPSITQSTQILCYSLLWRANVFFLTGLWLLTVKYVDHVAPDSLLWTALTSSRIRWVLMSHTGMSRPIGVLVKGRWPTPSIRGIRMSCLCPERHIVMLLDPPLRLLGFLDLRDFWSSAPLPQLPQQSSLSPSPTWITPPKWHCHPRRSILFLFLCLYFHINCLSYCVFKYDMVGFGVTVHGCYMQPSERTCGSTPRVRQAMANKIKTMNGKGKRASLRAHTYTHYIFRC